MAKITVTTQVAKLTIDIEPHADFITCLLPALIAAVPGFLESFMSCITGSGTDAKYAPGNRIRCQ